MGRNDEQTGEDGWRGESRIKKKKDSRKINIMKSTSQPIKLKHQRQREVGKVAGTEERLSTKETI